MLLIAPLKVVGGTGSPANPIALFSVPGARRPVLSGCCSCAHRCSMLCERQRSYPPGATRLQCVRRVLDQRCGGHSDRMGGGVPLRAVGCLSSPGPAFLLLSGLIGTVMGRLWRFVSIARLAPRWRQRSSTSVPLSQRVWRLHCWASKSPYLFPGDAGDRPGHYPALAEWQVCGISPRELIYPLL